MSNNESPQKLKPCHPFIASAVSVTKPASPFESFEWILWKHDSYSCVCFPESLPRILPGDATALAAFSSTCFSSAIFLETSPKLGLLWTSVSVTRVCSMSVLPLLPFCKRAQVREHLAVKYDHLFQEFPDLRSLLPNPADHTCKRTWERACFRCRELCRLVLGVEERGERASCHNFVLKVFEQTLELNPELRSHLPEPANDSLTDREWLGMAIAAYLILLSCDELQRA